MQTSLRKIGNSRGVLIPAALLAACEIGETVEMRVENNRIIIEPVAPQHRQGWFTGYQADQDPEVFAKLEETAIEQDEWQW
jgi:antitoxin MazE